MMCMLVKRHVHLDHLNLDNLLLNCAQLGGSGVLVQPMTYIFDEEPQRWKDLLARLGLKESDVKFTDN